MGIDTIIVGAFILYAAFYLARYIYRSIKGKQSGCGSCSGGGCHK